MFYGIMTLVVAAVVVLIICFNKPGLLISEEEAVEAVIKYGYSDVTVLDKSIFNIDGPLIGNCGVGDDAEFEVAAMNPRGQRVRLTVCADYWRGFSIKTQ